MQKKKNFNDQRGFTLVEIAIVMAIIGLLLGGVLKGQAMIQNAKIKSYQSDIDGIRAAWYSYFDRYGKYPGDDDTASAHQWTCGATIVNGNGDGNIDAGEQPDVFMQLRCAGLLGGDSSAANQYPTNAYGGRYVISYNPSAVGSNGVYAEYIPGDVGESVDNRLDDGTYNTGVIRANAGYNTATVNQAHRL